MEMHNPPHPGRILKQALASYSVTAVAQHLGVSRLTLSKILNCRGGITPEMSLRLSAALGSSPNFWFKMQAVHDMWQAAHKKQPKIAKITKLTKAA